MNSQQYEEFCRYFLAEKLSTDVNQIKSARIPTPKRLDSPEYKHQIDLYWEIKTELGVYLNIANAKWRSKSKVNQPDLLLLQQVKEKVAAHKALMLTNQGYTKGAIAVAKNEGIALHIVRPNFETENLPTTDRDVIQDNLLGISVSYNKSIFTHEVVHRAFDFSELSSSSFPGKRYQTQISSGYTTRVDSGYSQRTVTSDGGKSGRTTRGGGSVTKDSGFIKR